MSRNNSSKNLCYEIFFAETALVDGVNFISGVTRIENNSVVHADDPGATTLSFLHSAINNGLSVSVSKSNSSGFLISDIKFFDYNQKSKIKYVLNGSLGESIEGHIKNIRNGDADIVVLAGIHGYDDMLTNWTLNLFDALVVLAKDNRIPIIITFNAIYDGDEDRENYGKFKNFTAKDVVEKHAPFTGSGFLDSVLSPHLNMFVRLDGSIVSSIAWRDPVSGRFTYAFFDKDGVVHREELDDSKQRHTVEIRVPESEFQQPRHEYETMLLGGFTKSVVEEVFNDYDLMLLGYRR